MVFDGNGSSTHGPQDSPLLARGGANVIGGWEALFGHSWRQVFDIPAMYVDKEFLRGTEPLIKGHSDFYKKMAKNGLRGTRVPLKNWLGYKEERESRL